MHKLFSFVLVATGRLGILVTASQDKSNQYDYNIVSVVLLTEVLKLVISAVLYCKR